MAIDARGRIRYANRAAEAAVGSPPGGLTGKKFDEVFSRGPDVEHAFDWHLSTLDGSWLARREGRQATGPSRAAYVATFVHVAAGDSSSSDGALCNESEERYRQLVELSPEAVMLDRGGRLVYMNPAASRLLGARRHGALLGRRITDFIHPEDVDLFLHHVTMARDARVTVPLFESRMGQQGRWGYVETTAGPITYLGDPAVLLIVRDVTRRVRAIAEAADRTHKLREAEQVGRLKDHFLSTISHEMKTPLSLIIGYAELLEDSCGEDELLDGIRDGARRLTDHINTMLDYTALIGGSLPLYRTETVLPELIDGVVRQMQPCFEGHVGLHVEVLPDTPPICADPRRIGQVLAALLENARKFTPDGGDAGVRCQPEGSGVAVEVWDTGIGIPPADQPRIWQPFTQLQVDDAHRRGGLGLGLTIARRLVEMHGGHIDVDSAPGRGSRFHVYLPRG